MSIVFLLCGIILSFIIRIFFIINGLFVGDQKTQFAMGEAILKGENPFISLNFNIYPPTAMYLEALVLFISNLLHIPFHILNKIGPNIADLIMSIILYRFLINLKLKPLYASFWSLIFILNPISIIIPSAHSQLDSIPSLFLLCSIYILTFKTGRFYEILAPILIGIAISIKPNPAMLLPIFLLYKKSDLKQKLVFLSLSIAPTALTLTPYLMQNYQQVFGKLLSYSGVYDFGYAAIFRGLWYQKNANFWLPLTDELLNASKLSFITGGFFLAVLFTKSKKLARGCLSLYLLFLTVYFGISAQYYLWILPLAVIEREKMIIPYSLSAIIALFGFYMFFGPDILFGKLFTGAVFQSKYMPIYVIGNLITWLITSWWLIKIIKDHIKTNFSAFSNLHKKIVKLSFIIFGLSLLLALRIIVLLILQLI